MSGNNNTKRFQVGMQKINFKYSVGDLPVKTVKFTFDCMACSECPDELRRLQQPICKVPGWMMSLVHR